MALFSVDYILSAFLIFVRVASMIMTAPFFSSASFPKRIKLFFALATSFLLASVIPAQNVLISAQSGFLFVALTIISEVLVGVALGLVGQLIFAGLEMAGRLISLKITISLAEMVDSMTQQRSNILSNLFAMVAVLVFLSIDGDKIYLNGLIKSFDVVPVNQAQLSMVGPYMLKIATYLFVIGVQISSPFIIVLFLLDISLAIFARIMPQANLMFIAVPIKLGIGFGLLLLIIPYIPGVFDILFQRMFDFVGQLLAVMS